MFRWEDESVYDAGSNSRVPHMLLSSRRHFRKPGLEGSRSSSAYDGLSGVGKGDMMAYLVQMFNKPHQIIVLEALHTLRILLTVKYVGEFIMKPG